MGNPFRWRLPGACWCSAPTSRFLANHSVSEISVRNGFGTGMDERIQYEPSPAWLGVWERHLIAKKVGLKTSQAYAAGACAVMKKKRKDAGRPGQSIVPVFCSGRLPCVRRRFKMLNKKNPKVSLRQFGVFFSMIHLTLFEKRIRFAHQNIVGCSKIPKQRFFPFQI